MASLTHITLPVIALYSLTCHSHFIDNVQSVILLNYNDDDDDDDDDYCAWL